MTSSTPTPTQTRASDNARELLAAATVLVVDDHPANLTLIHKILTRAGVTNVHTTTDPSAVVDLFRQIRPDLVMLDLHMPGMDGVAVMEALVDESDDDDFVPVIVLTADATTDARNRVLAAGANDFLTKPIDTTEVVLRTRNLLESRALHGRLREHNHRLEAAMARRLVEEAQARAVAAEKADRVQLALDSGAPRMVFQPIVELASGQIVGQEALARFDLHPDRTPDVWFAEAAEVGRLVDLELAAIRAAICELEDLAPHLFLTLNVSPATAETAALAGLLADQPAERLLLEITEHARVDDYDHLMRSLGDLRTTGIGLAVDDAGAGFASLQHICRLAPDVIKLDITLTRDIDTDPVKRALAASLVQFSREIDAKIIAEGIETAGELETLIALGVPWGQGFHLGRPGALGPPR